MPDIFLALARQTQTGCEHSRAPPRTAQAALSTGLDLNDDPEPRSRAVRDQRTKPANTHPLALRLAWEAGGMTAAEVAERTGVSAMSIYSWQIVRVHAREIYRRSVRFVRIKIADAKAITGV